MIKTILEKDFRKRFIYLYTVFELIMTNTILEKDFYLDTATALSLYIILSCYLLDSDWLRKLG
jgi:hypothetical protein